MTEHENAAVNKSNMENDEITAKTVMVGSFHNISGVSSSNENNLIEEQFFEVPITNNGMETEQISSNDSVMLVDKTGGQNHRNICTTPETYSGVVHVNTVEIEIDANSNDRLIKEPDLTVRDNTTIISNADKKRTHVKKSSYNYMEYVKTIVLDDDEPNERDSEIIDLDIKDNYCDTVETTSSNDLEQIHNNNNINVSFSNAQHSNQYDEIYQSDTEMAELIEVCLNMQNTDGMTRVIYKTLIPIFKDTDPKFRQTDEFKRALSKTINMMKTKPLKKFSLIKNFCDILKNHKAKKRVTPITLKQNQGSQDKYPVINVSAKRKKTVTVIDLDADSNDTNNGIIQNDTVHNKRNKEYPPIEIHDDSSSDNLLAKGSNVIIESDNDDVIILESKTNSNNKSNHMVGKTNTQSQCKSKKHKKRKLSSQKSNENDNSNNNVVAKLHSRTTSSASYKGNKESISGMSYNSDLSNQCQNEVLGNNDPRELLVPALVEEVNIPDLNLDKIRSIEGQIAECKHRLETFEEMEVTIDSNFSPYIMCGQLKLKIVQLYKELCKLTDTDDVKRRRVKLKVGPGHPEGPVRCLEEFLNNNINKEGNTPFPDIQDVVECVCKANEMYQMNWTRTRIMSEAYALFTQFGQEMQRRRQSREWSDLMSLVKCEVADPADRDPQLRARLHENSVVAKKNDEEILERYVKMEQGIQDSELQMHIEHSESDSDDADLHEEVPNQTVYSNAQEHGADPIFQNAAKGTTNDYEAAAKLAKDILSLVQSDLPITNSTKKSDVESSQTETNGFNIYTQSNNEKPIHTTFKKHNEPDSHSNINVDKDINAVVEDSKDANTQIDNEDSHYNNEVGMDDTVKPEPKDILSVPVELGNNCSTSHSKENVAEDPNTKVAEVSKDGTEIETVDSHNNGVENVVGIVKREPLDIPRLLAELGDNFLTTVFDIDGVDAFRDPFLVIDISDSSDSEGEHI